SSVIDLASQLFLSSLSHLFATSRKLSRSTVFSYTTLFRSNINSAVMIHKRLKIPPNIDSCFFALVKSTALLPDSRASKVFFCRGDRKSTRLNSSHVSISYAVFCLENIRVVRLVFIVYQQYL